MARLQRQVVMLSLLDDQPRDQVARSLGISDGYVRVLLHRAREHVRTCSYEYDDDEPIDAD
jgi:DNA-directed RNA polymerase specialized sigma24 family protein